MACSLHLLYCDTIPGDINEEQDVLVVEGDDPLPPDGAHERGAFRFVTTVLANYDDLGQLTRDVRDYWRKEAGDQQVSLELLTADVALMQPETQAAARSLRPGYWNLGGWVAFLTGSQSGHKEARAIIVEASLKTQ